MQKITSYDSDVLVWYDGPVGMYTETITFYRQEDGTMSVETFGSHQGREELLRLRGAEVVKFRDCLNEIIEHPDFDPTQDAMYGVTQEEINEHLAWLK